MSSQDNRPALLNIRSMPTSTALQFTTDVLDAVVNVDTAGNSFTRFELQPKGFLHPNTQLVVELEASSDADIGKAAFPFVNIGLYSLIQRAVLKTADGTTICETDDLADLLACKSQFVSNSANKEREQYKTGRQITYEQIMTAKKGQEAGGYGLSNSYDYDIRGATGGAGGVAPPAFKRQGVSVENHLLNKNKSSYALSLHDLFPYLKSGNQLPLFMMPRVQLEIYWTPLVSDGRLCSQTVAAAATAGSTFKVASTFVFADYLFYPNDFMAEYQQKNNDLTFSYIDYRLSKNSLTQTTGGASVIRNIGGNGMQVLKVFAGFNPDKDDNNIKLLQGRYSALGGKADGADGGRTKLTSNLFYNNEFIFPQSVSNPATHFHHLISAEGGPAYVSREHYCGEGNCIVALGTHNFMGLEQRSNLQAKNLWQGFKINNSAKFDSKGADFHTALDANANSTQRVWLEILRFAKLTNGKMSTFFA